MGSSSDKWKKAKQALGCLLIPKTLEIDELNLNSINSSSSSVGNRRRLSDSGFSVSPTSATYSGDVIRAAPPMTPTPSSKGLLRFPRSSSKSSPKQKLCAICLNSMIPGQGQAIFTAECSHTFHFNCIASNVKHGSRSCPVCRAKWKDIPFQSRSFGPRDKPRPASTPSLPDVNHLQPSEPGIYNDDDLIEEQSPIPEQNPETRSNNQRIEIKTLPEVSAIPKSTSYADFTILIHLKAPVAGSQNSRAPVDLVTVLDVSGSMAGTKLALLKRAMGFVIQHLGPNDRLSVIAFSSTARRLFSLRRMTETGRIQALQAVNSLSSNGGTNIAEGLKKGAKVMLDRRFKNPVSSIILLSDGQDTYTVTGPAGAQSRTDYKSLLPNSIQSSETSLQIPVHTFGFGADHDAGSMHSIAEGSGGTFSFIEVEGVIQDAFAQCMGGLLSVVTQELTVSIKCIQPSLQLKSIEAGSYHVRMSDTRNGIINVGDLYAEEEKHFLATLNIPNTKDTEMSLLKVNCTYRDPLTNYVINLDEVEVKIDRPNSTGQLVVSIEVDKQRNRLRAAKSMSEAKSYAERGDLTGAIAILEKCREMLSESASFRAGDQLTVSLCNELKEIQERMSNRQIYEASGRAYVLSGMSSHSWQRATARGDNTSSTNLSQVYQTTMMADMITRSQTMVFGNVPSPPAVPRSLSERLSPR